MRKPLGFYWYQFKLRMLAAWRVLFSDFVVVVTANKPDYIARANTNVTHQSFWNMVWAVDGPIEKNEADAKIMHQVEEALNKKAL